MIQSYLLASSTVSLIKSTILSPMLDLSSLGSYRKYFYRESKPFYIKKLDYYVKNRISVVINFSIRWLFYLQICHIIFIVYFRGSLLSINVETFFSTYDEIEFERVINKAFYGEMPYNIDISFIEEMFGQKYDNCPVCHFKNISASVHKPNSTQKDLILCILFGGKKYNMFVFARSLRTVGCMASIILFVTHDMYNLLTPDEIYVSKSCGINIVQLNKYKNIYDDRRSMKMLIYKRFINDYYYMFDRIYMADMYDTFFQGDPFSSFLADDKVTVSIERVHIFHHEWFSERLRQHDNCSDFDKIYSPRYLLNIGIVIGKSHMIHMFYNHMFNNDFWKHRFCDDQPILNILHKRNIVNFIDVDYKGLLYISSHYSIFQTKPDSDGFFHEVNLSWYPAVIHQYDRICPVMTHVREICPRLGIWDAHVRQGSIQQNCQTLENTNLISFYTNKAIRKLKNGLSNYPL